ncbi:hypothetical protein DFH06DRAFT_1205475 [Mycena polygramma]|nr:hypothetical protein DFH06DRAFT_1205475 [Mycena polygramma]
MYPVGYCSQECQRRDWKAHKIQCKIASQQTPRTQTARAQVSASQLSELLRVGGQHTIYQESTMLGLDPLLITGANGEDFYLTKVDGARNFWRLEAPIREQWEAKAQVHNRKAQRFWTSYLSPISIGQEWVDVVLDAVLNVRLPSNNRDMWQDQVNANIIAGLFPHLRRFTPAQNTTLLDLFASRVWNGGDDFRLQTGTNILFGHGQPTLNLIEQLIGRCLSWTRPYSEIDQLIGCVALPIQKHWPELAGTRILDLVFAMLTPGRPGPASGRTVPGDKILEIAETSPAACKHLLPAVMMMFKRNMIGHPASSALSLCESFGIALRGRDSDVLPWLMVEFIGDDHSTTRLQKHLADENAGKLARFGLEIQEYSLAELQELNKAAMERLGNPKIL